MASTIKRARWWWGALLLVLVAAGAAFILRKPKVVVLRPTRGDVVQSVVASGRVLMAGDVELAVTSAGRVVEVLVQEGQRVTPGQLLLRLDDAEARIALEEAAASVTRSLVELRRVRQKAAPLAKSSLQRAEVDVEYAEREMARTQQLFGAGAQTVQRVQETQQALALAKARRDAAQIELASTLPDGTERELVVTAMRQAEASLERARTRLDDCRLLAPVSGTVVELHVDAGDSVQPAGALVRLVVDGPVQLEMEPDERNLALLKVGQMARASAEAFPDQSFAARVNYIAPKVDPDRGTIKVRLELSEPPNYLRADMTVSIEVEVNRAAQALTVPTRLVRDLVGSPWLLLLRDGRAVRQPVSIGVRGEELVEVRRGIDASARVIDSVELAPGAAVRAQQAGE